MRAAMVTTLGGPASVGVADVEEPAGDGRVIIDVQFAGVTFPDVLLTRGQYQIRPPLPFTPGIIQVEHTGNRIDPETVYVIFFRPEHGAGEQKIPDLMTSVIENIGSPLFMLSESGIGIFIQMGAVKIAQPETVLGEMGGHPVQDHPDFVLMALIYKEFKLIRRAETGGG